uniref:Uncharacterized protein n=1 Tax=Haemonchus contortus TaxID=6289 RepID=A0A7I4Z664_HAECO
MVTGVISRLAHLTRSTVGTKQTDQEAPVFCADTKDIGGTNAKQEMAPSRSECKRVSYGIKNELKRFGLFEAEEKSTGSQEARLSGRTEKAISILKPPSGESTILRYQDEDKKRSRTMSTSVAEAQSRSGAHSRQGSMLFGQQVLGQDIPCGTGDDYEVTRTTLFMMSSSENQQSRTTVGGSRYTV